MLQHRFAIGQEAVLNRSRYSLNAVPSLYRITVTLPENNSSRQYRIRRDGEPHGRMVTETSLEALTSLPQPDPLGRSYPSIDRIAASRPGSHELLEYARLQESDSDGTLRRIRRLVEDNRLL